MTTAKYLILSILLLSIASCATLSENYLKVEDRKLTWADFDGKVDKSMPYDAFTQWDVLYEYTEPQMIGDTAYLYFTVWRVFNGNSWVKDRTVADKNKLLNHEQGHYDIAGLCVKELQEEFDQHIYFKETYDYSIDSIYHAVFNKWLQIEKRYDLETNHLYNEKSQKKWDAFFKDNL